MTTSRAVFGRARLSLRLENYRVFFMDQSAA
jgi:hypothetical protein